MKNILSNRHCEKCNISTGKKGIISVENENVEYIETEEEAADFIKNILKEIDKNCIYCGSNNWNIYNISIDNKRLRRENEMTNKQFLNLDVINYKFSFVSHLHQYYLEGEKESEFYNENFNKVVFNQSFIDEHTSVLEKMKKIFLLRENVIEVFRLIIEDDYKQLNFESSIINELNESVFTNNPSFYHNSERILEFTIEKDQYSEVQSLRMIVTEGFFKLFQFLNSRISNSYSFVNYDENNFYNSYFVTIYNQLQIKIFPIIQIERCFEIKITQDLLQY